MSRIQGAPAKGAFVREFYRQTRKRFDRDLEPVAIAAHNRAVLAAMGGFELALERAKKVEPRLKALAELKAAVLVGCEFCIDIGSFVGARDGVTHEQIRALADHRSADCFDDLELAVLDYADAMTRTPVEVTDELFERLRRHLDEAQLVELTAAIAWENWRARFNWAFDIGAAGFAEGAACPLPDIAGSPAAAAA